MTIIVTAKSPVRGLAAVGDARAMQAIQEYLWLDPISGWERKLDVVILEN